MIRKLIKLLFNQKREIEEMTNETEGKFLNPDIWSGKIYNGTWVEANSTKVILEPATGDEVGIFGVVDPSDVTAIANKASIAQSKWANTGYDDRAGLLRKTALLAEDNFTEIVEMIMRESGSIRPKAEFELSITIKALHLASSMPSQSQGLILPADGGKISMAKRLPIGVVGVISPFNFPLYLAMRAVAPAIAVGNSVVLKPDLQTAISGGIVIARLFEVAGLPEGVLSVIPGNGEVGQAMCLDPKIGMIQFTGSTRAGRMVGKTAGEHLKKVSLELGGKNSLIILEDADMDLAVKNATWGAYLHQGQICMTSGRILVHESIATDFIKRLVAHIPNLPCGDPKTDQVAQGPLINAGQIEKVQRIISESVAAGAILEAGGTVQGPYIVPAVLSGVKPGMPAYEEEIFGPVAAITTFSSDEEAISFANDTEYGLSCAILSNNVGNAILMGDKINSGLLHINDSTVNDDVVNPFGGVGKSGNGTQIGGPANWEEFTHWRWITIQNQAPAYPL